MKDSAHEQLEEWTVKFGGTAILGFLCCLLVLGKGCHHMLQKRGLIFGVFIIPSCILSGFLGLICITIGDRFDSGLTKDLLGGLSLVHKNLLNFVFAALMLGISCKNSQTLHKSAGIMAILASVFHEGMPMLIYSQIIGWGQSAVCLVTLTILESFGHSAPMDYASMIPIGLEAGTDVYANTIARPSSASDEARRRMWSLAVIEEAESIGLIVVSIMFIVLVSWKPYIVSMGDSGSGSAHRDSIISSNTSGTVEAFEKPPALAARRASSADVQTQQDSPSFRDREREREKEKDNKSQGIANLGTHLSLIALVVFLAFTLKFLFRLVEIYLNLERRIFSNLRMFKLAMFCAMFGMHYLQRKMHVVFVRDWFMRLSGLMLDLMVIAAFSVASPLPETLITSEQYWPITLLVIICAMWNIFAFFFFAHRLFPNFWFERGLTLTGDAMGHSFVGLLFVRTLDPHLESPVPYAYVFKLLLFFIPSSGEKNTIVVSIVESHGSIMALVVCINIAAIWLIICEKYFSNRFILSKYSNRPICVRPEMLEDGTFNSIGNVLEIHGSNLEEADGKSTPPSILSRGASMSFPRVNSISAITPDITFSGNINFHTEFNSDILTLNKLAEISTWLPECHSTKSWQLKFSLKRDGACLDTMMMLCCPRDQISKTSFQPCVILVEDSWGYVFGGFISPGLQNSSSYYGNGESFGIQCSHLFHFHNLFSVISPYL